MLTYVGLMVSEVYKSSFYYESMGVKDVLSFLKTTGAWPIWTPGVWLAGYMSPLDIATYQTYKLWASWFQRKRFLKFFPL